MVGLRAENQIDRRGAADDLLALGLGDAAGDGDDEIAVVLFQLLQLAELGINLLRGFFTNVAGVEHDQVGGVAASSVRRNPAPASTSPMRSLS